MTETVKPCCRCGRPGDEIDREGEFVSGGYGSRHDLASFCVMRPDEVPEGAFCDPCVDEMIGSGAIVQVYSLDKMLPDLPEQAYAALFRAGQSRMMGLIEKMDRQTDPEGVQGILAKVTPHRERDAIMAGMISALLGIIGRDLTGADTLYAAAVASYEKDSRDLHDALLADMRGEDPRADNPWRVVEAPHQQGEHAAMD